MALRDHEEADMQTFVHVEDAVNKGYKRTPVDTILAVVAVAKFDLEASWTAAKSFHHTPSHEIARSHSPLLHLCFMPTMILTVLVVQNSEPV